MKPNLTAGEVVTEYLAHKALEVSAGLHSQQSLDRLGYFLSKFTADFGQQLVTDCRRGDLKRFLAKHPEFKSPHTQQGACGHVVTCFRWAEEDGLIDRCPYARPKDLPTPEPRAAMRREEYRAIMASARQHRRGRAGLRLRWALWFLWHTGCRTCEMRRLEWCHYDDVRGVFELPSKSTRKTGKRRLIVLPRHVWRAIRLLRQPFGHVFRNSRGTPWNKDVFARLFRKVCNRAGVRAEVTAYCSRHGFCCELLEAGAGERQIADVMGHASTRYVSWYGRDVRSKVDYLRQTGEMRK